MKLGRQLNHGSTCVLLYLACLTGSGRVSLVHVLAAYRHQHSQNKNNKHKLHIM